jgi:hypothetical protein
MTTEGIAPMPIATTTSSSRARRTALLASTMLCAAALMLPPSGSHANTAEYCKHVTEDCTDALRGAAYDNSAVDPAAVHPLTGYGENTEYAPRAAQDAAIPFRISVDGDPVAVSGAPQGTAGVKRDAEHRQRTEDLRLEAVDIQVKFDGLNIQPSLNVTTKPIERLVAGQTDIEFFGSWNYPDFIAQREVRILDLEGNLVEAVAMSSEGQAFWRSPEAVGQELDHGAFGQSLSYTLRVYDRYGRFDETVPLPLKVTEAHEGVYDTGVPESPFAEFASYGDDRTAVRNIPIHGGAVTIYGNHVPEGHTVTAFGREIPLGIDRDFITQQIVKPGTRSVEIAVLDEANQGLNFSRDILIPENEWFYVGLADLAVGRNFDLNNRVEALDEDDRNRFYTRGRAAGYIKGKIQGKYLLTAAADTGDEELSDLFDNFDERNPRELLRRLDPDDFYPVYGDDSTTYEDAPTRGKFYVRLERGDSHVMWGNFKTRITGTEFARHERGLYGANAYYRSEATTSFGERRVTVHGFAAEPNTLPQRDEFRGTGGSAYFLQRQDITVGSEQITLEIRDRVTGLPKSRQVLRPEEDYTVDYIQGVVILRRPVRSTAVAGEIVRDGQLGGDDVFVLAQYEFSPTVTELDEFTFGTRTEAWVTDNVRLGGSAYRDREDLVESTLVEGDVTVRLTDKTYVEAEVAVSEGPGQGVTTSVDGGFRFVDQPGVGTNDEQAVGIRLKGALDLQDVGANIDGQIGVNYEDREAGFNALDRITTEDTRIIGGFATVSPNDWSKVTVRIDDINRDTSGDEIEATLQAEAQYNEHWSVGAGVTYSDRDVGTGLDTDGRRLDVGGKITYEEPGAKVYGFGQVTVDRDGGRDANHRIGVGAEVDVTDRISTNAEISTGAQGLGVLAGISYEPTVDQRYYFGYRLDADRTDGDLDAYDPFGRDTGSFVFGANRKIDDHWSVYGEENFDLIGGRQSLTHTYGVTYTPDDRWKVHGSAENGTFSDDAGGDFERTAISAGVDYSQKGLRFGLRGEARIENSEDGERQDRDTYLFSASSGVDYNPDWRGLVHVDAVISNSDESAVLDGDYVEGSIGLAYRPVDNDRFNGLARYTFLYDLPGPQQVNAAGETLGPRQRSHIISLDGTYDINEYLSVGAKYGYRIGQISDSRIEDDFVDSQAHLGVLRADLHIVKNWDAVVEGRILYLPEAESTRTGAFAAIYRHFGDNLKLGVGYNFADFSDDLSDVTFNDEGLFVNVIGKF